MKKSWSFLEDVFARRLEVVWTRRLEDVLITSRRCLQNVLRRSWRYFEGILKMSWRHLEDVWPTWIYWSWLRRLEDVLKTYFEDVWLRWIYLSWSRRLEDVFYRRRRKTSSTRLQDIFIKTNVCRVFYYFNFEKNWGILKSKSVLLNKNVFC